MLTEEQGKPLEATTTEVFGMAAFCRYFTSLDLPVEVLEDSEGEKSNRIGILLSRRTIVLGFSFDANGL